MTAETTAAPSKSKTGQTVYVVLAQDIHGDHWRYAGQSNGRSAVDAIKRFVEDTEDNGQSFVAVPARSWRPVTVTVETKTTIRLG